MTPLSAVDYLMSQMLDRQSEAFRALLEAKHEAHEFTPEQLRAGENVPAMSNVN